jgi:hypothetical protein
MYSLRAMPAIVAMLMVPTTIAQPPSTQKKTPTFDAASVKLLTSVTARSGGYFDGPASQRLNPMGAGKAPNLLIFNRFRENGGKV